MGIGHGGHAWFREHRLKSVYDFLTLGFEKYRERPALELISGLIDVRYTLEKSPDDKKHFKELSVSLLRAASNIKPFDKISGYLLILDL